MNAREQQKREVGKRAKWWILWVRRTMLIAMLLLTMALEM